MAAWQLKIKKIVKRNNRARVQVYTLGYAYRCIFRSTCTYSSSQTEYIFYRIWSLPAYRHVRNWTKNSTNFNRHNNGKTIRNVYIEKAKIISPVNSRTTDGPMTEVVAKARELEQDNDILAVSYFMVQPWLDFEV